MRLQLASRELYKYRVVYSEKKTEEGDFEWDLRFEVMFMAGILLRYTPNCPLNFYCDYRDWDDNDDTIKLKYNESKGGSYFQVKKGGIVVAAFPKNETFDAAFHDAIQIVSADPYARMQVAKSLGRTDSEDESSLISLN
jgi:hypothetical protein